MTRCIIVALAVLTFAGVLGGCQSTGAENLPPPRLVSPVVVAPTPLPGHRYAVVPAPASAAPHETHATASMSQVPAEWKPKATPRPWTWIIIHHSDSLFGSAALIDKWHRARGFDELGYHFVIGNGTNSGDGQIEVGPRWAQQKWGAHDNALDNRYNLQGIGICLVGNFDKQRPTAAQKRSLVKLVAYLMRTYHVMPNHVLGHGETKQTDCPGRYMNVAEVRSLVSQSIAEAEQQEGEAVAASK